MSGIAKVLPVVESERLVFDSSALILFLNDALSTDGVTLLNDALHGDRAMISAIVRAEVLAWPAHSAASLNAAKALLDVCQMVPVDVAIADEGARIRRETGLKLPDALIAATVMLNMGTLVTANGKDFRRVPGLVLIDA